jgi:hypothetical protein
MPGSEDDIAVLGQDDWTVADTPWMSNEWQQLLSGTMTISFLFCLAADKHQMLIVNLSCPITQFTRPVCPRSHVVYQLIDLAHQLSRNTYHQTAKHVRSPRSLAWKPPQMKSNNVCASRG